MDCNCTCIFSCKMAFTDSQEFLHNGFAWVRAIKEVKICVSNAHLNETIAVVFVFVESDDSFHIKFFEDHRVILRSVAGALSRCSLIYWAHEGQELVWDDPIEISVFDTLIVFILFDIKCCIIIPSLFDGEVEAAEAVLKCALILALSFRCISKWLQEWCVVFKLQHYLWDSHLVHDD